MRYHSGTSITKGFEMKAIKYIEGMEIPDFCFIEGMPDSVYHSLPGISNSGLSMVARSPAHYAFRAQREPSRAMAIGSAFHAALLEPERFAVEWQIVRDVNDRRKAEYKDAAKVYGGEKTLTDREGNSVEVMASSVASNKEAREILNAKGYAELSAFAIDPETKAPIRARYDWITADGRVLDVKKTQDCRERAFQNSVYSYRYHCQEAMYSHVYELITGVQLESFSFLAIEEQPPCANIVWTLDALAKDIGRKEYRSALDAYALCAGNGEWPAYPESSGLLSLPEWVLMQYDDQDNNEMTFNEE